MKLFIVNRDAEGMFTLPDGSKSDTHGLPFGAMWRCTCHGEKGWLISLPHKSQDASWARLWCTLQGTEEGRGWTVIGEAPNITVTPSINCMETGGWHGFIVNGEISEGSYN